VNAHSVRRVPWRSQSRARRAHATRSPVRLPDRWAYHVSSVVNRASILDHGLDVTHMGRAAGIAGSTRPEVEGIFLADSLAEAFWFASFGVHVLVDVWIIDVRGLRVIDHPDGFMYYPGSISPDRVRLDEADVDSATAEQRQKLETSRPSEDRRLRQCSGMTPDAI
jgi:hypothetical protein